MKITTNLGLLSKNSIDYKLAWFWNTECGGDKDEIKAQWKLSGYKFNILIK